MWWGVKGDKGKSNSTDDKVSKQWHTAYVYHICQIYCVFLGPCNWNTHSSEKKTCLRLNTNTSLRSWYQLVSLKAGGQCRGSPESRSFFQSRSQAQVVSFWTSHKPPSPSPLRRASLVSREDKPRAQSSGSAPLPSPPLCTPASLSATSTWYFARSPDDKTVLNKICAPTRPFSVGILLFKAPGELGANLLYLRWQLTTWKQELLF